MAARITASLFGLYAFNSVCPLLGGAPISEGVENCHVVRQFTPPENKRRKQLNLELLSLKLFVQKECIFFVRPVTVSSRVTKRMVK